MESTKSDFISFARGTAIITIVLYHYFTYLDINFTKQNLNLLDILIVLIISIIFANLYKIFCSDFKPINLKNILRSEQTEKNA